MASHARRAYYGAARGTFPCAIVHSFVCVCVLAGGVVVYTHMVPWHTSLFQMIRIIDDPMCVCVCVCVVCVCARELEGGREINIGGYVPELVCVRVYARILACMFVNVFLIPPTSHCTLSHIFNLRLLL